MKNVTQAGAFDEFVKQYKIFSRKAMRRSKSLGTYEGECWYATRGAYQATASSEERIMWEVARAFESEKLWQSRQRN